jgi:hypothetical protein
MVDSEMAEPIARMPFDGESPAEICGAILRDEPVLPSQLNPHVSPTLEAVILRAWRRTAIWAIKARPT